MTGLGAVGGKFWLDISNATRAMLDINVGSRLSICREHGGATTLVVQELFEYPRAPYADACRVLLEPMEASVE